MNWVLAAFSSFPSILLALAPCLGHVLSIVPPLTAPSCLVPQYNKQILIDAIVHAVNEDYVEMAGDFCRLGFLAPGTDITPIVPALEAIWQNSTGKGLADFNFRTVTGA